MKNKIYAISLLLSFLIVLSHEMIAHHHHDDLALNFSVTYENADDHEHKHDSQKEEKSNDHQSFPFHRHISASNDIYIERTNLLESNSQIRDVSLLVFSERFRTELFKPPELEDKRYEEPTFLPSSLCNLEAFALRGPPAIV